MVARVGSIKQASERLHVTQPTLTTAIKKLESEVGVPLLIRRSKGVELTDYGKLFLAYVEEQQDKHVDILHRLQDMQQREMGKLKLGVGEAWWELFVKEAIQDFNHQYPKSSLYIEFGNNLSLMQHLIQGDIDLFIGHEVIGLQERFPVTFKPLFQDIEAYYVRADHPLVKSKALHFEWDEESYNFPVLEVTPTHSRYTSLLNDALSSFDSSQDSSGGKNKRGNGMTYEVDSLLASIDMLKMSDAIMPYTGKVAEWLEGFGLVALHPKENKVGNVGIYHKRSLSDMKTEALISSINEILS